MLTILNVIVVSLDRFPIDPVSEKFISKNDRRITLHVLGTVNTTLVALYLVEVFMRIAAHSLQKFLQENFNIFEFIISILCLVKYTARHI